MKIGVDLGGTNMRTALVKEGNVIKKTSNAWASRDSLESTIKQLTEQIALLINPSVQGIGIGVPSVVDIKKGIVYNVENIPSWKEVHLKDLLEDAFQIPVQVNNDSNCFALGEKLYGKGKPFQHVVVITLGTGVGAGIIINEKLYTGSNTGAGEIGLLPYLKHNFEYYCSSNFFRAYSLTGEDAYRLAQQQDKKALRIWEEFGVHLGNLMKAVMFAYDPHAIIIGGGISQAIAHFQQAMKEEMADFPYTQTINKLQLLISDNNDSALLGASAL